MQAWPTHVEDAYSVPAELLKVYSMQRDWTVFTNNNTGIQTRRQWEFTVFYKADGDCVETNYFLVQRPENGGGWSKPWLERGHKFSGGYDIGLRECATVEALD